MPKTRTPDLADWEVSLADPRTADRVVVTVRAGFLRTRDGWLFLEEPAGSPLFAAPASVVLCVRRLEPGLNVKAAKEGLGEVKGPDPAGAAAETVATPAQRRRRASGAHT